MNVFPYSVRAIRVSQPLGDFFVAVFPAEILLQVCRSDQLRCISNKDGSGYKLAGTQRSKQEKRLTQISNYINRGDSAFPNSIIIAANYDFDLGYDQNESDAVHADSMDHDSFDSNVSWFIAEDLQGGYTLTIPSDKPLAAIIDGQHRLFAFAGADPNRLKMELICSVFIDLPKPLQAQLFATINSNQKPVERSLTYELFGYNIDDESASRWTPEKLAVYLTRRLATEQTSPMFSKISVAPKQDLNLKRIFASSQWHISTAVIVDGILRLISSNPKRDSNLMQTPTSSRERNVLKAGPKDQSPLREVYISGNDTLTYAIVENYLRACDIMFWSNADSSSYILKTVGVQALFDILRKLLPAALLEKNVSADYFKSLMQGAKAINFSDTQFINASGSGRSAIRKAIEASIILVE